MSMTFIVPQRAVADTVLAARTAYLKDAGY